MSSPPPGYVPFLFAGFWPDVEGATAGPASGPMSYPPNGGMVSYPNLYKNNDPTQGPIDAGLQGLVFLKRVFYGTSDPNTASNFSLPALPAGGHYTLSSRSVTRTAMPIFTNDPAGSPSPATDLVVVVSGTAATQVLDLPHGATLTHLTLSVDPVNATPPAGTKVAAVVVKRNILTNTATTLSTTTDPTTSTAYGAQHTFDTATISEVIDRTAYTYHVNLSGETSTGAANCTWFGCTWTATVTGIDDGAS